MFSEPDERRLPYVAQNRRTVEEMESHIVRASDGFENAREPVDGSRVLTIRDLSVEIRRGGRIVHPVSGVDLALDRGETLGIVGETGSGKSMTGLAVMGMLPDGGRVTGGSIDFGGTELVGLPADRYRALRGNDIAMVFQDSMTALNPTRRIGEQVAEPLRLHQGTSKRAARARAADLLDLVGIPKPLERLDDHPHQLSGGMRQRVMIAMALACEPRVVIADEPTTALDVSIQAEILDLLDDLRSRLGMSMILITHDMGVIARHADRVGVMYAGRVAETGPTPALFSHTRHRYTHALLSSIPSLTQDRNEQLFSIPGTPPDLSASPWAVPSRRAARRDGPLSRGAATALGGGGRAHPRMPAPGRHGSGPYRLGGIGRRTARRLPRGSRRTRDDAPAAGRRSHTGVPGGWTGPPRAAPHRQGGLRSELRRGAR